jgi:hypothetical protein
MWAMQVVVLAGSHWSQLPPLNISRVPSQYGDESEDLGRMDVDPTQ